MSAPTERRVPRVPREPEEGAVNQEQTMAVIASDEEPKDADDAKTSSGESEDDLALNDEIWEREIFRRRRKGRLRRKLRRFGYDEYDDESSSSTPEPDPAIIARRKTRKNKALKEAVYCGSGKILGVQSVDIIIRLKNEMDLIEGRNECKDMMDDWLESVYMHGDHEMKDLKKLLKWFRGNVKGIARELSNEEAMTVIEDCKSRVRKIYDW